MKAPQVMQRYVNPPEYGLRLMDGAESETAIEALKSRDLFRYHEQESFCTILESRFRDFFGVDDCTLVSNGSSAIQAALFSLGIGAGDIVLINAYTFIATSNAVLRLGATPVPVDFDQETNLDLDRLQQLSSLNPKAVVAVHWPGRCFDLGPLRECCEKLGVPLVEDACQAFASKNGSGWAGLQGAIGVFSFQQNKLLTCGEGGCVISRSKPLMDRVRRFTDHGIQRLESGIPSPDFVIDRYGDNIRMTGIQAAILLKQFEKLPMLLSSLLASKRRVLETISAKAIREWNPSSREDNGQIISFRFKNAASAQKAVDLLSQSNVLMRPIWRHPYYHYFLGGIRHQKDCPAAEEVSSLVMTVPLSGTLDEDALEKIAGAILRIGNLVSHE